MMMAAAAAVGGFVEGSLYTWGIASDGKLGNDTTSPSLSSPVQVGTTLGWRYMARS